MQHPLDCGSTLETSADIKALSIHSRLQGNRIKRQLGPMYDLGYLGDSSYELGYSEETVEAKEPRIRPEARSSSIYPWMKVRIANLTPLDVQVIDDRAQRVLATLAPPTKTRTKESHCQSWQDITVMGKLKMIS